MLGPSIPKQAASYILRRNGLPKDRNKHINKAEVNVTYDKMLIVVEKKFCSMIICCETQT